MDPKSEEPGFLSAYTKRFSEDEDAKKVCVFVCVFVCEREVRESERRERRETEHLCVCICLSHVGNRSCL